MNVECRRMRAVLFFVLSIILAGLTSCHEPVTKLDVKQVVVSQSTDDWELDLNYSVFSSADASVNESCELLNDEVQTLVEGLQDSLKSGAEDMMQSLADNNISRPEWKCVLWVRDSVFMATPEYISVRLTVYSFTGGAHGMTWYYAFNYDVENRKVLSLNDMIEPDASEAVDRLLKAHFENPEDCFDTDPTLDRATCINFSSAQVCCTYAQYELGPYACGAPEVSVPRTALKDAWLLPQKK